MKPWAHAGFLSWEAPKQTNAKTGGGTSPNRRRVALKQVSGWDCTWFAIAQAMLSFLSAKPPCSCAVKRGLRPLQGTPAVFCCILGFGESREVLKPVLLNWMWRKEKVTDTAPLQVQLATREDCCLEEKKSFALHLYH